MANNYYNFPVAFVPGTKVRSEQVNIQYQGVEAGFDLLPTLSASMITGTSWFGTDVQGATVNEYLITTPDPQAALVDGQRVAFFATHTNDGAVTFNVDTLGVVNAVDNDGTALVTNDVISGQFYEFVFDNANTQWVRSLAGSDLVLGGVDTQIQYNDGGVFGGTAGFTFVKGTLVTALPGDLTVVGLVDGRDVAADGTAQDAHIADATIHFTEASIDHANILNIGVNSHAAIDTHIADATIHFTEASISIPLTQGANDVTATAAEVNLLDLAGLTVGDVLSADTATTASFKPQTGSTGITVEDEGVPLATLATTLDFVGAGVVASGAGATKTITIAGGGTPTSISDADGDTKIQTEESADEDVIRIDLGDGITGFPAIPNALIFSAEQFTLGLADANVAGQIGGDIDFTASRGNTTGRGGNVGITAARGGADGDGGGLNLTAGEGGLTSGDGGDITLTPGLPLGAGSTGAVILPDQVAPSVTTNKLYSVAGALTWNGIDLTAGGTPVWAEDAADNIWTVDGGAMALVTTGVLNFVAGNNAGIAITEGDHNIIIGDGAATLLDTGFDNIVIGASAGAVMTGALRNILIGDFAGELMTLSTSQANVLIGRFAGDKMTDLCVGNTIIGNAAGGSLGSASRDNVIIGENIMNGPGSRQMNSNVFIGDQGWSQSGISAGTNWNIGIGFLTGRNVTGVSTRNILIGNEAGPPGSGAIVNQIFINNSENDDPFIGGDLGTGGMTVKGSIRFTERADHIQTPVATFGEFWVRNDAPNVPMFTDDAGTDFVLNSVGGSTQDPTNNSIFSANAGGALEAGGTFNFLMLDGAGDLITTGDDNIAIGRGSLPLLTTGSDNIAIGPLAGEVMLTGFDNVMIGHLAGDQLTAENNTFVGAFAGRSVTDSTRNVAIGYQAMGNTSADLGAPGASNVAVGDASMSNFALTSADHNTAIGASTLNFMVSGDDNVALGYNAGGNITTGDGNVILGNQAGPTVNQSNRLYISNTGGDTPLIFGDFATPQIIINGALETTGYFLPNRATDAELNAIANAINTDAGKVQGAMVYNTSTDNPVYATGATDGSVWVDGAGTTVNTPV